MKTTVVCGLLGAGKTTFIQQYLENRKEKTLVIVNDFGNLGIDGEILSLSGVEYLELPSGCVCCTLKFDLITSIKRAKEQFAPEHLIIEPSGIASPIGILEALETLNISPLVVCIVDASEFSELYESNMFGNFLEDQIKTSDIVIVNKIDISEKQKIERASEIIKSINPEAITIKTIRSSIGMSLPLEHVSERQRKVRFHSLNLDSFSIEICKSVGLKAIETIFNDMASGVYGDIFRAKALIETDRGPYRIDLSSGIVECLSFGRPLSRSRIVVIGENIDRDRLKLSINQLHKYI